LLKVTIEPLVPDLVDISQIEQSLCTLMKANAVCLSEVAVKSRKFATSASDIVTDPKCRAVVSVITGKIDVQHDLVANSAGEFIYC
jgi:hypothetical protein